MAEALKPHLEGTVGTAIIEATEAAREGEVGRTMREHHHISAMGKHHILAHPRTEEDSPTTLLRTMVCQITTSPATNLLLMPAHKLLHTTNLHIPSQAPHTLPILCSLRIKMLKIHRLFLGAQHQTAAHLTAAPNISTHSISLLLLSIRPGLLSIHGSSTVNIHRIAGIAKKILSTPGTLPALLPIKYCK